MKNIVVSAASLRMGGAVTIYNQFLEHLKEEIGDNQYFIFVNKVLQQPKIDGVRYYVIDIEARKKRNWFDNQGCKEILQQEEFCADAVISLQNTAVCCLHGLPQLVYYHQPLPFFKKEWNPFKKDERSKFIYKYFYLHFVKKSIDENVQFVVQTEFLKQGLVKRLNIDESRVYVCFPDVELPDAANISPYPFVENTRNFIFPSLYSPHKSHIVLLKALEILKLKTDINKVRLYITVSKEEAPALYEFVERNCLSENVIFMGKIPYQETLRLYKSADALLFPSTIETLGLPLIEAASFGLKIIAPDVDYAHEVLEGYEGVQYAMADDAEAWATSVLNILDQKRKTYSFYQPKKEKGWKEFFSLI